MDEGLFEPGKNEINIGLWETRSEAVERLLEGTGERPWEGD